jgi:hypothetical protein
MGVPVFPGIYHPGKLMESLVPELGLGYPGKVVLHVGISLTPLVFHVGIITMNLMRVVEKDDKVEVPLPLKFF